jgi:hypothetical protein
MQTVGKDMRCDRTNKEVDRKKNSAQHKPAFNSQPICHPRTPLSFQCALCHSRGCGNPAPCFPGIITCSMSQWKVLNNLGISNFL